jgi:hypothetical protein
MRALHHGREDFRAVEARGVHEDARRCRTRQQAAKQMAVDADPTGIEHEYGWAPTGQQRRKGERRGRLAAQLEAIHAGCQHATEKRVRTAEHDGDHAASRGVSRACAKYRVRV